MGSDCTLNLLTMKTGQGFLDQVIGYSSQGAYSASVGWFQPVGLDGQNVGMVVVFLFHISFRLFEQNGRTRHCRIILRVISPRP